MGVDFQDVTTGMGTKDELTSQVSFLRLNPLVSYKVNEAVTLGATLMVGYSQAEFSMYPETYSPGRTARPARVTTSRAWTSELTSFGFAGRVGAQVKVGPMVRLGATYTSESTIKLDGRQRATLNFGAMDGQLRRRDAGLHLAPGVRGGHRGHAGEGADRRRGRQVDQLVGRDRPARR